MLFSQFTFRRAVFSSIKWSMAVSFLFGGCDKKPALPITTDSTDTTQIPIQDSTEVPDTTEPIDPNQPFSVGGFNVYFGHLHNHSNVSDGTGSPSSAYEYARDEAGLDFFGLADHAENIDSSEWAAIKKESDEFNQDNAFVTFWGFEWTSSNYGHVAVIGTDDYCSALKSGTSSFEGLCSWLSIRDAMAFFNHPGRQGSMRQEFDQFAGTVSDKFVGMELWNKSDGFSVYYYNDGFYSDDNEKCYFDEALSRGWNIGAAGSDDNHYGTWGTANQYRLAILASKLTRSELIAAIKSRRFYSTLDKNLLLSFKLDGQEMGSTITSTKPFLQVTAKNEDGESFEQLQLIDRNRSVVKTWSLNSSSINIKDSIEASGNGYFYIIIKQSDGSEAISSPIWVNNNNGNNGNNGNTSGKYTIEKNISEGMDDVEEGTDGKIYTNSSDIELIEDSRLGGTQTVGLRFIRTNVPNNAVINDAWLQFTCDEETSDPTTVYIRGEASDNSAAFTEDDFDVSSRPTTTASVTWSVPAWNTVGNATKDERSPDLKSIIQEIVSRKNFTESSAITLIITGEGSRIAEAYEGSNSKSPKLYIEYEIP